MVKPFTLLGEELGVHAPVIQGLDQLELGAADHGEREPEGELGRLAVLLSCPSPSPG